MTQQFRLSMCGQASAMRWGISRAPKHYAIYAVNCDDTHDGPLNSFVRMWAFLLGNRGVSPDDTIVICGEISGITAARGLWFLEYLGHSRVHMLDGGFTAWAAGGYPVARDAEVAPAQAFPFTQNPDVVATYQDVLRLIDAQDDLILDTRSRLEFIGEDVRAARGGAIPGAIHVEWLENLTEDGPAKPADELRRQFEAAGVTLDKEIVAYCQTSYQSRTPTRRCVCSGILVCGTIPVLGASGEIRHFSQSKYTRAFKFRYDGSRRV